MSSEDQAILEAARRTSDLLGLERFQPTQVSWKSVIGAEGRSYRVVTPHFPYIHGSKLIISPILQGRLDQEDWGPIFAPALVFSKRLKGRFNIGALSRILPGIFLLTAFVAYGYTSVPRPDSSLIIGFIVASLVLIFLGAYSTIRLSRNYVLWADSEAAKALGTQSLTDALRKLEHLRELDASSGNDWPEFGDHPSIATRIANLQNP